MLISEGHKAEDTCNQSSGRMRVRHSHNARRRIAFELAFEDLSILRTSRLGIWTPECHRSAIAGSKQHATMRERDSNARRSKGEAVAHWPLIMTRRPS